MKKGRAWAASKSEPMVQMLDLSMIKYVGPDDRPVPTQEEREKYLSDPNAYARSIEGLADTEREALVELNQEKMIALGMHPFVSHAFRRVLERAGILVAPAPKNIK